MPQPGREPPHPTQDTVQSYIGRFDEEERDTELTLGKAFGLFPDNTAIDEVWLKVILVNSLYATAIFATYAVAKHIVSLDIDPLLRNGDTDAVDQVARIQLHGGPRNNYSFATKYCAWHNPCAYPIYDSFVAQMLLAYGTRDGFETFCCEDLREYGTFKRVVNSFRKHYNLTEYSLKDTDKFLWRAGRECFPRSN
jgi:hypothetical protein